MPLRPRLTRGRLFSRPAGAALTSAGGAVIVALALMGGAISGKLEHGPAVRRLIPTSAAPTIAPTTTRPAPSSTTPQQAAAIQTVKLALIDDMTLDLRSQRLDADVQKRLAAAQTPAAVARRHSEIALAWAPDKVVTTQTRYDEVVRANATNPASPSVTDGAFVVTRWGDVTIAGDLAHATCRGHYRLIEVPNPQAPSGAVEQPDRDWMITLRQTGGRWRLEDRSASP